MSRATDLLGIEEENTWIVIENEGEPSDIRLLTTMGATSARGNRSSIGQFGTGLPNAIAMLLREGIDFFLFPGTTKYSFDYTSESVPTLSGGTTSIRNVRIIKGNGTPKDLGFTIDLGYNWNDLFMAFREIITNAADASDAIGNDYSRFQIRYATDDDIKGEKGKTRFYLKLTYEFAECVKKFSQRFMIKDRNYDPSVRVIPKREPGGPLRVFRKGILVGEFPQHRSLFDYNFGDDLPITDDRRIDLGDAECHIPRLIQQGDNEVVERYLQTLVNVDQNQPSFFETTRFSGYSMMSVKELGDVHRETWNKAFVKVFGDRKVMVPDVRLAAAVRAKGYDPVMVRPDMMGPLQAMGGKSVTDVLNDMEMDGRQEMPLTDKHLDAYQRVWNLIVRTGMNKGKATPPPLHGFKATMEGGGTVLAYWSPKRGEIGLSLDILTDSGEMTLYGKSTLIEEFAHYITGATDESRDLQTWAFDFAAALCNLS